MSRQRSPQKTTAPLWTGILDPLLRQFLTIADHICRNGTLTHGDLAFLERVGAVVDVDKAGVAAMLEPVLKGITYEQRLKAMGANWGLSGAQMAPDATLDLVPAEGASLAETSEQDDSSPQEGDS